MTAAADLILAAQQRADRVNGPMPTQEWLSMVNYSAARLYRKLTATFEDYNVSQVLFTLQGGDPGNTFQVGPGSSVGDFSKLRVLSRQVSSAGGTTTWSPLMAINSLTEMDMYTAPPINPIYNNVAPYYALQGNLIVIVPPLSAGGTYKLKYLPAYQPLVQLTDTIDGQWLTLNGIDECIVLDVARKALIKEESYEAADRLGVELDGMFKEVMRELSPRDDNQPGRIMNTKRVRQGWGFGNWGRGP